MKSTAVIFFLLCLSVATRSIRRSDDWHSEEEELAKAFLSKLDQESRSICHERALAEWNFNTNLTEFNSKKALEAAIKYSKFWRRVWAEAKAFRWQGLRDPEIRRQFSLMSTLGSSILPDQDLQRYNSLRQTMESRFGKAKICDFYNRTKCDLALEPDITNVFVNSRNPAELEYIWFQWRNATGRAVRTNYTEFVSLIKSVARLNGFNSATDYELRHYETEDVPQSEFREEIDNLWETLKPLYKELHAYVRFKLKEFYGNDVFLGMDGKIPAHLLGNLDAETWENIESLVIPFKNKEPFNITQKMLEKGMTPLDMARMAERFFVSLGLPKLGPSFWRNSIFQKPKEREMICHASAWDLCSKEDFRIKQCTEVTETDLLTLHHELGHIYYMMSYHHLPKVYQDGANPGFHEAIGDLVALSVQTPTHMESVGLITGLEYDEELEINFLLRMALTKIAFLPYGLILDKWKWDFPYSDDKELKWNCEWWKLREEVQGIGRPINFPENETFLDPASKYHVISNVPYIRYFISMILQFQLHEALCNEADYTHEFHKCDIFNSKRAGRKLLNLLSLGTSQPWPVALEAVTGTRRLSSKPMFRFFEPLYKWLKRENIINGQSTGWSSDRNCGQKEDKFIKIATTFSYSNSESSRKSFSRKTFMVLSLFLLIRHFSFTFL